jgi:hypothetical protein
MRCPRCRDASLVTAQCAPGARVPGCTRDGYHEHHACARCGFAWIGDPPVSEMDAEGREEFILDVFEQIVRGQERTSRYCADVPAASGYRMTR